ncbi:unnamed protein product [Caenorhabditis bovis]|uniref:Uncharacterized protein n=1 Tax=Caenorhabditis bovis TaxID=2654633 RepID=A0A8S1EFF8_9PELO|nr:unnamed protein product [Caenorhabditis bovis]
MEEIDEYAEFKPSRSKIDELVGLFMNSENESVDEMWIIQDPLEIKNTNKMPEFIWECTSADGMKTRGEKELVICLLQSGIIKKPNCHKCGHQMKPKFRNCKGNSWICRRRGKDCSSASMKQSTFFSRSHIRLVDQVFITISWLSNRRMGEIADCSVSKRTIYDQIHQFRTECVRYWKNLRIGGEKIGVELKCCKLENSAFINWKCVIREKFAIIGIERTQFGQAFVEFVDDVQPETIRRIIQNRVNAGSFLICDEWRNAMRPDTTPNTFSRSKNVEIGNAIGIMIGEIEEGIDEETENEK